MRGENWPKEVEADPIQPKIQLFINIVEMFGYYLQRNCANIQFYHCESFECEFVWRLHDSKGEIR